MTPSQWVVYFADELVTAMPSMSYSKALAFGKASHQNLEPEASARGIATVLAFAKHEALSLPQLRRQTRTKALVH